MYTKVIRKIGLSLLIGTFAFGMTIYATPNEDKYAKVKADGVAIIDVPNKESINIRGLQKDELIQIGDQVDNYTQVLLGHGGRIGYIETEYIDLIIEEKETEEAEEPEKKAPVVNDNKGQEIVNFALKHVGNPYKYGGTSLTNGADCSGFTSQVYKNFGINIQRTSGGQYASNGKSVKKSDLQPGDLVFYGYNGKVTHVAMYAGNSKIVHAGTAKTGIHVSPMEQRGMAPYMGAKRII